MKGLVNTHPIIKKKKPRWREDKECVNSWKNLFPGKASGPDCEFWNKCTSKFSAEEKDYIITILNSRNFKSKQNTFFKRPNRTLF